MLLGFAVVIFKAILLGRLKARGRPIFQPLSQTNKCPIWFAGGHATMPNEIFQKDFVESLFYQDLEVSQELYDYVTSYDMEKIDHVDQLS